MRPVAEIEKWLGMNFDIVKSEDIQ